jgi:hypothetical protein
LVSSNALVGVASLPDGQQARWEAPIKEDPMKLRPNLLGLSLGLALLATPSFESAAQDHAYIGSNNCRKCHMKQYKSWAETKMAKAFEHLKPGVAAEAKQAAGLDPDKDYTSDAACLPCHTTGYGKEGGFVDIATTPDLAGVGCEMCHGAGGSYTASDKMSRWTKLSARSATTRTAPSSRSSTSKPGRARGRTSTSR